MYKSVYDLSPAEMEELRQSYFYQLQNESPEILQGITDPEQIPDDIIQEHYSGVSFVDDDFSVIRRVENGACILLVFPFMLMAEILKRNK